MWSRLPGARWSSAPHSAEETPPLTAEGHTSPRKRCIFRGREATPFLIPSMALRTDTNLRAGLYARVSTEDRGQDPETQLRPLREYAERRGFGVVGEFVDRASGTT